MRAGILRRQLLLSTTVLVGALTAYGRSAYGQVVCNQVPVTTTYRCIGPSVDTQDLTNIDNIIVLTGPGPAFVVDTTAMGGSGGHALSISGDNVVVFADYNASSLTSDATSSALVIMSTGDDLVPGGVRVNANSTFAGGARGISAINYGSGIIEIIANGDVTGTNQYGIYAYSTTTTTQGLSITTGEDSTITGGDRGISAWHYGSSTLDVTVHGEVTGTAVDGILAVNEATSTSITITTEEGSKVTGGERGISAWNFGSEALTITAKGEVTGTNQDGIYAYSTNTSTGGLSVTTAQGSTVTGGERGIGAWNYGGSALEVTAHGEVTGSASNANSVGIFARNQSDATSITITTHEGSTVGGSSQGIFAGNYGTGALDIKADGDVTGTGAFSSGIFARSASTSDERLTVTTGVGTIVSGDSLGIAAYHFGTGAVEVIANGDVTGAGNRGIVAYSSNLGNNEALTVTTVTGTSISGGFYGIAAQHVGGGALRITTNGSVTGLDSNYAGIFAGHNGGQIEITVNATSTVTSPGYAIRTRGGAANVTVAGILNGGGGGAVQFDQGVALDDRLTLFTTAAINGDVFGGLGTDTLALKGGGTGTFNAAQLVDFESGEKTGRSHWTLTGTNTEIDNFAVNGGLLSVNGALPNAAVTVNGGELGGTGTVGSTTIANGGVFAPGNSIGTMTVNGAFTLKPGAIFEVEVNAAGQGDKVIVTGTVNLTGSVLKVIAAGGNYKPKTDYLIVDNDGADAVVGKFAKVTTNFAFLTPSVNYQGGDGNDVVLSLFNKNIGFCSVATTQNQCSVANALSQFPGDDPLFLAVLFQTAAGARQAFDALSGEIHATLPGVLADDSRYVREAVLGRLMQASYTTGAGQLAALGAGGPQVNSQAMMLAPDSEAMQLGSGKSLALPPADPGLAFWTRAYGAWGDFDGNRNAASAERNLGGFVSGVDAQMSDTWRLGLAAGGSWSNISVDARHSSAQVESFNLAAYAGGMAGPLALRAGGAWSWQDVETNRAVVFPGFFERQESSYDADTGQIFGEIAYPLASGGIALEPFAGLAYVNVDTERFREHGGALSALTGSGNDQDLGYSTLGLRAATALHWGGTLVVPKISAAWQHAFDDVTPGAALAFATTGIGFGMTGVPLAEDSLLIEAGLDFALSPTATLGVSYSGQHASEVSDNAVKGRLTWLF